MNDGVGRIGTAVVFGASSDIARATTRAFAARHTRTIVLAGRDPAALEADAGRLRASGVAEVETIAFDALRTDEHPDLVDDVFDRHGDVDVALLTFGVLGDQEAAEKDVEAALEVARTNYVGAVSLLIPLARRMREQGHGSIVVVSSVAGERGRRSNFVYGSSKAGLDVFCQGLGDRLRGEGVHVLVVRPGFVRSKMTEHLEATPLATTPDAVARAIVGGIERRRDVVWVPSPLRWVMSGLRHLPRPVFRKLEI